MKMRPARGFALLLSLLGLIALVSVVGGIVGPWLQPAAAALSDGGRLMAELGVGGLVGWLVWREHRLLRWGSRRATALRAGSLGGGARADPSVNPEPKPVVSSGVVTKREIKTYIRAVGARLRAIRQAVTLTQGALAGQSGLPPSHLSLIENGRTEAFLSAWQQLAQALRFPLGELLYTGRARPTPHASAPQQPTLWELGRNLKFLREKNRVTVSTVSQRGGYRTRNTFYRARTSLLNEGHDMRVSTLYRVARAIGVTIAELCSPPAATQHRDVTEIQGY